jgi:SAM-dependent methyltransferase
MTAESTMRMPGPRAETRSHGLDFLCVDAFIRTLVDARALKTAFELGLVEHLQQQPQPRNVDALGAALGTDRLGLRFLLDLLAANRVVEENAAGVRLHGDFERALRYRDLLEMKLDFAGFTMNDFADLFTALIRDPARFTGQARLFELFDYRRALTPSAENYERTRGWMRLTSTLTRYEAQACMQLHDFGAHRRMLDVGGNSGELALQLCRRHAQLRATVFDLPLVCEIGMEHVLSEPEAERISFIQGDLRSDPLPAGYDLIAFKSMLHDWPQEQALDFLARAADAVEPGGTLLIFERGPVRVQGEGLPFSMLPIVLFFRSYRRPSVYAERLEALGMRDLQVREIVLDSPFFLVTATRPAA